MDDPPASTVFDPFSERWLEAVSALEKRAGDAGWSRAQFERELNFERARFFVLTSGDALLGYGGFWKVDQEAQVTNLVIAPEMRRQGLGRRLVQHLLADARVQGCRRCRLEVRSSNVAARALYASIGFRMSGCRPGLYEHPADDGILMEREL